MPDRDHDPRPLADDQPAPGAPAAPLPVGWQSDRPRTWALVRQVPVVIALPTGGSRLAWREVVASAAEFGPVDAPGPNAAAWWAGVLRPIHDARVARVRFPALFDWPEGCLLPDAPPDAEALARLARQAVACLRQAGIGRV